MQPGLTFDDTNVLGTPLVNGTFPITISVVDSKNNSFNITTATIVVDAKPVLPPVASCTVPAGSKGASGHAAIKTVSAKTVTIGSKLVTLPDCLKITYKGKAKAPVVGYDAEFKGYTSNNITYAT